MAQNEVGFQKLVLWGIWIIIRMLAFIAPGAMGKAGASQWERLARSYTGDHDTFRFD